MKQMKLSNGLKLPMLGYGTFLVHDKNEIKKCLSTAIRAGYRHFDTALVYLNEEAIGDTLNESSLSREEYFLTTKFFPISPNVSEHFLDLTIRQQLKRLKTDYIDLYLLHCPVGEGANLTMWKVLEKYYQKGIFKSIGVSNYWEHHIEALEKKAKIMPHMNQIHISPHYTPERLINFSKQKKIEVTAYSMFKSGELDNENIKSIAKKYNKSTGQVILRWGLQRGFLLIPKSSTPSRIIDNITIFDFKLTKEEMKSINQQNKEKGRMWNPEAVVWGGRTW